MARLPGQLALPLALLAGAVFVFRAPDAGWDRTGLWGELSSLLLGFALLAYLPPGRPTSLAAHERGATLAFAYVLGLLVAQLGLDPALQGLFGLGLLVLRRLLGPAAMTPGRAPAAGGSVLGSVVVIVFVVLIANAARVGDPLPVVFPCLFATVLVAAEGQRCMGQLGHVGWGWALAIGVPLALGPGPVGLGLVAAGVAGLTAIRRADRRQLALAYLALALVGCSGFAVPAVLLGAVLAACLPRGFRADALPWAAIAVLACLPESGSYAACFTAFAPGFALLGGGAVVGLLASARRHRSLAADERWLGAAALLALALSSVVAPLAGPALALALLLLSRLAPLPSAA